METGTYETWHSITVFALKLAGILCVDVAVRKMFYINVVQRLTRIPKNNVCRADVCYA